MAKRKKTLSNRETSTPRRSSGRPEMNRICNLVPSRNTENDWTMETALAAGALAAPVALPPSVDLRAAWWDIGNQEQTGSCVGWGSTDGVARYQLVKAGKLDPKIKLSPRFTWMASRKPTSTRAGRKR